MMGNGLVNETDIDLLVVPPVTSPLQFSPYSETNDDFSTEFSRNIVYKVGVFKFSPISRRIRVEI